jgi:membrane protein
LKYLKNIWYIIIHTFRKFGQDNCATLAAALSYYTIFSIAPMLVIVISMVGTIYGKDAIQGQIFEQVRHLLGDDGALTLQSFIQHTYEPQNNFIATVIGLITLFFAATGVFTQLKFSLNTIWNVKPNPRREFLKVILDRLLSFAFIILVGTIMISTLILHAVIAFLGNFIEKILGDYSVYFINMTNLLITVLILAMLFASMFKVLPDAVSKWKDILIGGIFTSVLFIVGEIIIGYYLGNSNFSSTYGAAGSVIIILIWVNYSSFILFLGACFTYVYARKHGRRIMPNRFALSLRAEDVPFHGNPQDL